MKGISKTGRKIEKTFYLICQDGHGMNIPAIPAIIAVKMLINNGLDKKGAYPFIGLISLDQIIAEIKSLNLKIKAIEEESSQFNSSNF